MIWRKLVGARIRADWQYRASFVLFTISQFLAEFFGVILIVVLFSNVDRLAGWSIAEIAVVERSSPGNVSVRLARATQVVGGALPGLTDPDELDDFPDYPHQGEEHYR